MSLACVLSGTAASVLLGFGWGIWGRALFARDEAWGSLGKTAELTRASIGAAATLYLVCAVLVLLAAVRATARWRSWPWLDVVAVPLMWLGVASATLALFGSNVWREGLMIATLSCIIAGFSLWQHVVRSTSKVTASVTLTFGVVAVGVPIVLSITGRV